MLKKTALLFTLTLPTIISPAFAEWDEFDINEKGHVRAVWSNPDGSRVHLESASEKDKEPYREVILGRKRAQGDPDPTKVDATFKAQNLDRQEAGNPFHLYSVRFQMKDTFEALGYIQLGRMPSINYPEGPSAENATAHHPIIQKFISLGITQKRDAAGGLDKDNIERIGNRGIAFVLPVLRDESLKFHNDALKACHELVCKFSIGGSLLPVEKTNPHVAMSLLCPEDRVVESFISAHYDVDDNEGFGWFYPGADGKPRPRIMVTHPLPQPLPNNGADNNNNK